MLITREYLRQNPNHIFVFGDNLLRRGKGGAAKLRDEPNTYGFITKKTPSMSDQAFYKPDEYRKVFREELAKLEMQIRSSQGTLWWISPVGSGLANRYGIYEEIIKENISKLADRYDNVRLTF